MSASSDSLSVRVFSRIALFQAAVLVTALLVLGFGVRNQIRQIYLRQLNSQLAGLLEVLFKQAPQQWDQAWCKQMAEGTPFRVSVISATDGHILCDNTVTDPKVFQLILDRPEVQMALHSVDRKGRSLRMSRGLNYTQGVYSTLFLPDRKVVLRVGFAAEGELEKDLASYDRAFLLAIALLSLLSIAVLQWTARRFLFKRATEVVDLAEKQHQEDLVANVSHEFRTPLTSIKGFADALLPYLASGRAPEREHAEIIQKDADRLLLMVNDLLDLSMIDARSVTLTKDEVDTEQATQSALKRLLMVYGSKQPKVETLYSAKTVYADADRLFQILINIVGNSMKYCPAGVSIQIAWSQALSGEVTLSISDNGPGIPKEVQGRVFKRFLRTGGKLDAKPGAGLGLAIVKGLMDVHGGTVTLDTSATVGTRFVLTFPKSA